MLKLSEHILYLANKNELNVTLTQLNKILYLSIKDIKNNIDKLKFEKLYDEPFLVWMAGPVIKSVNDVYENKQVLFGKRHTEFDMYDKYISKYLGKSDIDLVSNDLFNNFWCKKRDWIVNGRSHIQYSIKDI